MSRTNDGLDPSSTTDAYGGSGQGNMAGMRGNDGLDTSNTTDAYSSGGLGGRSEAGGMRGNDGLQTSSTTDAYSSGGLGGRSETGGMRGNDGLQTSNTTDAYSSGGMDRSTGGKYADPSYGDRTSGGLGYDDTIGSGARTGGAGRGGDQETSRYTSGGLGQDDTYGTQGDTGGADSGISQNYGMGSGRTAAQEQGGVLPTEPGRDDVRSGGMGGGRGDYDQSSGSDKKGDSTMGKMMEKAGGLFKNEKMQAQGEEKRREAGGY